MIVAEMMIQAIGIWWYPRSLWEASAGSPLALTGVAVTQPYGLRTGKGTPMQFVKWMVVFPLVLCADAENVKVTKSLKIMFAGAPLSATVVAAREIADFRAPNVL